MKTIAFYLPQFHEIELNNIHHGKGFTEWTNVKKAVPLYQNHNQPRIPLDDNYYNLLDKDTLIWQTDLARKYNIYGFCMYHYWYSGKKLLEKPIELYLNTKNANLPFCLCWANHSWSKTWTQSTEIMQLQTYGDESEWKDHFEYLLPFFKDSRYIKNDNKPLFVIYLPQDIPNCKRRFELYNKLAIENGFAGIDFAFQEVKFASNPKNDIEHFSYGIEYQPGYAIYNYRSKIEQTIRNTGLKILDFIEKKFHIGFNINLKKNEKLDYVTINERIIKTKPLNKKMIPGCFVDFDNTPRKKEFGMSFINNTPENFEKYFRLQVQRAKEVYKKDMLFITAWNEWAEGAYLEPDTKNNYKYLEIIKKVLSELNEVPLYE